MHKIMDNKFKVNLGTCKTDDKRILEVDETFLLPEIEERDLSSVIRTLSRLE